MVDVRHVFVPFVLSFTLVGGVFANAEEPEKAGVDKKVEKEEKEEKPSGKKVVGDPIVAKIGTAKIIRRSEVLATIQSLPPSTRQQVSDDKLFEMVLERLVRSWLLAEAAKKAGLEKDTQYQKELEKVKTDLLARFILMKEVQAKLTEQTLEARYKKFVAEFPKGLEYHLWHILVKDEAAAQAIIEDLKKGAKFQDIAKEKSIAPSKEKGGDEGYVMLAMLPPQFASVVEALKPDEFNKAPIKTELGSSIVLKGDSRNAVPPKLEDIKQALASLVFQEEALKLAKKLEQQKKVELFNQDGSPATKEPETK